MTRHGGSLGLWPTEHSQRPTHLELLVSQHVGDPPDWQRTGFGAALMGEVFAIADAEGLGCYLETETEENGVLPPPRIEVRTEWDPRDR